MAMDDGADTVRATRTYCWTFANAEFDEARWQLRVAGQDVELEHKPLEVLQYLLRHAGEAVTKDELLAEVWAGRIVVEAVLTNAVGKLRRALADEAQDIVMTLPRVGYRLTVPVTRRPVEFLPDASRLEAGGVVPRRSNWKLESPLARTGGNEVWLARHAKTREARVFKFSLADKGLGGLKREVTVARLLREALGERGDFVRVLDWDFEQAPYFIESEYGGTSMDRWPVAGGIASVPVDRRLALFIKAVDAVAAAHAVGVLHKDLKPANLLIEGDGDDARLRVADFGSSRLFDSGLLDELGITRLGLTQTQAMSSDSGTPLYLAPEVVAGQSASIKSDVYALGVTLYQLLVGDFRRPLAPGWEQDIADPLLREDIADAANGDAGKRPESAGALADRLRNLASRREKRALDMAVQARIEDGEKRLAKARARRPWVVAAVVALLAGMATTGWYLQRSIAAEKLASAQREEATRQARRAEAVVQYLSNDLIRSITPGGKGYEKNPTIREMVEYASATVDESFKGDAATRGSMHAAVAASWSSLSDARRSVEQYRKAVRDYSEAFGESSQLALATRYDLVRQLSSIEEFKEADSLLEATDKLAGARLNGNGELALLAAWSRGTLLSNKMALEEAEPVLLRAVELLAVATREQEMVKDRVRLSLADIYQRQGKAQQVIDLMRAALADRNQTSEVVKGGYRNTLAQALFLQGKAEEALVIARQAAEATEKILGADARATLVRYQTVARMHTKLKQCEQALSIWRRIWDLGVKRYGMTDRVTLMNGEYLAGAEQKCGDKAVGEQLQETVFANQQKYLPDDPHSHSARYYRAGRFKREGKFREALALLDGIDVEKVGAANSSPGARYFVQALRAECLLGLGDGRQARVLLYGALDGLIKMGNSPEKPGLVSIRKVLEKAGGKYP